MRVVSSALPLLCAALCLRAAPAPSVRIIATVPAECAFLEALTRRGLAADVSSRLDLPSLETPLIVCATAYPAAVRWTPTEASALEEWVRSGGRAYIEYAVGEGDSAFGVRTAPEPFLARHERLAMVAADWEPGAGALLDEHISWALKVLSLPESARVVADYGRFLGTYRVHEDDTAYGITIDLGRTVTIGEVCQRFGAGRPDYYPERVEVLTSVDGQAFSPVAATSEPFDGPTVSLVFPQSPARYVQIRCRKWRWSPVTDFLFLGEVEVRSADGANVAQGAAYTYLVPPLAAPYNDVGFELTDGVVDGLYTDGRSVGFATLPPMERRPAVVEMPYGRGSVIWSCVALSDASRRRFRPSAAWERLLDHIVGSLVPTGPPPRAQERSAPQVRLQPGERRQAYRRALDRNMAWFRRSGILPSADGSTGVQSAIALSALFGGPVEDLPSSYRCDCNAMTAKALYLYGDVAGDTAYRDRALRIADRLLTHQFTDTSQSRFGGFPWLDHGADAIYFWDDNTRIADALLWLYGRTGEQRYLMGALRCLELCRAVAREDGIIAAQVVDPARLDSVGRAAFRAECSGMLAPSFDLYRWAIAAATTGDAAYGDLGRLAARIYGPESGTAGLPYAAHLRLEDGGLRESLLAAWDAYLRDPDVARLGVQRLRAPGDFRNAFANDCSINTEADEPLTDQLYVTSWKALEAWAAYKATGDERCLRAFEGIADYLVAIQCSDPDPRLSGCWMRGFDFEAWGYFGAPYDPNYGPYHAYSGWMNATISTALALYLLDESYLPPSRDAELVRSMLAEVRTQQPPSGVSSTDLALGATYTVTPDPPAAYPDSGGELTDGRIDGSYEDGLSVGWVLPDVGSRLVVEMTLDLGAERDLAMVSQRHGALVPAYNPGTVTVLTSSDGVVYAGAAQRAVGLSNRGSSWLPLPPTRARYIRIRLQKTRRGAADDWLFVGETQVLGPSATVTAP